MGMLEQFSSGGIPFLNTSWFLRIAAPLVSRPLTTLFTLTLSCMVRGIKAMESQRDHASGQDSTSCRLLRFPTHISDSHTIPAFGEDGCTHFHLPHI